MAAIVRLTLKMYLWDSGLIVNIVNSFKLMYSRARIVAIFINPWINVSILDFGSIPIETVVRAHFHNYVFSVSLTRRRGPIFVTQKVFIAAIILSRGPSTNERVFKIFEFIIAWQSQYLIIIALIFTLIVLIIYFLRH